MFVLDICDVSGVPCSALVLPALTFWDKSLGDRIIPGTINQTAEDQRPNGTVTHKSGGRLCFLMARGYFNG